MSIKVTSAVWERSRSKGSNLLVLLYIADCANNDGTGSWPSLAKIASVVQLTERQVRYILRELEVSGELITESGMGPNGTNSYSVNLQKLSSQGPKVVIVANKEGGQPAPGGSVLLGQQASGGQCTAPQKPSVSEGGSALQLGGQCTSPKPSLTVREPSVNEKEKETLKEKEKEFVEKSLAPFTIFIPEEVHNMAKERYNYTRQRVHDISMECLAWYRKKGVARDDWLDCVIRWLNKEGERNPAIKYHAEGPLQYNVDSASW